MPDTIAALTASADPAPGPGIGRWGDLLGPISDSASELFSVHDGQGRAEFVSSAALRLFGHLPETLAGDGFLELIRIDDRAAFAAACRATVEDGHERTLQIGLRPSRGSGTRSICAECRCRRIGERGTYAVLVATADISARKALERTLERVRREAGDADRAKGRILANVTHELRTPLNAIIGFSEVLGSELGSCPAAAGRDRLVQYAELINEAGQHLLQVVTELLDMSKIAAGRVALAPERLDLGDLLGGTARLMEHAARQAEVSVALDLAAEAGSVVADRRALRQIVLNLLSNAIKFSPPGGRVVLGARRDGEAIAIWVRDEGCGIPGEELDRLGEPFFQGSGNALRGTVGTGLGLSVVKGLAELHGGTMAVDSDLGAGTTVRIRLPDAAPVAVRDANPDGAGAL